MKISDRFREADRFPLNSKTVVILSIIRCNRSYSNSYMYHRSPYILSLCSLRESDRSCIAYQARPFYEREQREEIGEERNGIQTKVSLSWKSLKIYLSTSTMVFRRRKGRQFWRGRRCRFPSTIRRNNRGGAGRMQMSRDRAGHETHRDTGSKVHRARQMQNE